MYKSVLPYSRCWNLLSQSRQGSRNKTIYFSRTSKQLGFIKILFQRQFSEVWELICQNTHLCRQHGFLCQNTNKDLKLWKNQKVTSIKVISSDPHLKETARPLLLLETVTGNHLIYLPFIPVPIFSRISNILTQCVFFSNFSLTLF